MIIKTYKIVAPRIFEEYLQTVDIEHQNVLVKVDVLAICKADLRYYLGLREKGVLAKKYPLTPIHEAVGTVIKDPSKTFKPGQKVILIPNSVDESLCKSCVQKRCMEEDLQQNYCPHAKFASSSAQGFLRPYVTISAKSLRSYASDISPHIAVFSELLSVAHAAVRRVVIQKQDTIAIWGDGILSYCLTALLRTLYPTLSLTVIGVNPTKLEKFTFAHTILGSELDKEYGNYSICFECVGGKGSEIAIHQMIQQATIGGDLLLMGVSEERVALDTRRILEKGLSFKGVTRSSDQDFSVVATLLSNPALQAMLEPLAIDSTKIVTLQDIYQVFDQESQNTAMGKHLLSFE